LSKYKSKNRLPRYDKNQYIRAEKLRVIDDDDGNLGVMSKTDALNLSREKGLDLVLISPNQDIPVAKIIDWSKFKYIQSKKNKNKGKSVTLKEWWFKPKIEDHDIDVKLRQVEKFLKKGGKAKLTVKYVRRATFEEMYSTVDKLVEKVKDFADMEGEINKEGKNLTIFVNNKANGKS